MHNLWTDEQNSLNLILIKAELCTKINYSMTCLEFSKSLMTKHELLNSAKSDLKYSFRHKQM